MKNKVFWFLSFLIACAFNADAGWSLVNGPLLSGFAKILVASGNTIYAGTDNSGVFISKDTGASWTSASNGLSVPYITTIAIKDTNVYAGTAAGLFLSQDNGITWKKIDSGFTPTNSIKKISIIGDTVFVLTPFTAYQCVFNYGDIYSTTTNGANWKRKYLTTLPVLLPDSNDIYDSLLTTILPARRITSFAFKDNFLFAGTDSGIIILTKNGSSWSISDRKLTDNLIYTLTVLSNKILVSTDLGIFCSEDNGSSWVIRNPGLPYMGCSFIVYASGNFFILSDKLYQSMDNGKSWKIDTTGLKGANVNFLSSCNNRFFVCTDSGFFIFNNTAKSWENRSSGINVNPHTPIFCFGDRMFINSDSPSGMFMSKTLGVSWAPIGIDTSINSFSSIAAINSKLILFKSLGSWSNGSASYISTDSGNSWRKFSDSLPDFSSVVSCNNTLFGITFPKEYPSMTCPIEAGSWLFSFMEDGSSLTEMNSSFSYYRTHYGSIIDDIFYLTTYGPTLIAVTINGIFLTNDKGASWVDINEGLINKSVYSVAFTDQDLFAVTAAGIWRRPLWELPIAVSAPIASKPKTYGITMYNNKQFSYSLSREAMVSTEIYDMRGKLVWGTAAKKQPSGSYSIGLPSHSLPAGNYILCLNAGRDKFSRKFVILH
jgi:photosystem II stability/assembly factor-like uncharacterized protein